MDYLKEAKKVVEKVSFEVKEAKKLLLDNEFLQCLSEEIELSLNLKDPKVIFAINEDGNVNYEGILEGEVKGNNKIIVVLDNLQEEKKIDEQSLIIDKASEIAEKTLDLDLKLKKRELIDKLLKTK